MNPHELSKSMRKKNKNPQQHQNRRGGNKESSHNDNPSDPEAVKAYNDTVDFCKKNGIAGPELMEVSELINIMKLPDPIRPSVPNVVVVEVENVDTCEMLRSYRKQGLNPLGLSLASDINPGGGVKRGRTAQEECIFRRSNAFATHPKSFYKTDISKTRLDPECVIYSPKVMFIKDADYTLYQANECFSVGLLAVAALRNPKLDHGRYYDDDRQTMTMKIESIFKIAISKGHDSLVLGALGCGVFRNPPGEVADIFRIMIRTYGSFFKKIGFAVMVVKDSDQSNFHAFSRLATK